MTYFLRNGTGFIPTSEQALDLHRILPVGNYVVKQNPITQQLYFDSIDSFESNQKIYGKIPRYCNRILDTFQDRETSTGVMLTGEKGSGKTLLAKLLSIKGAEFDFPTIIINAAWCGDEFNQLIQDLQQPAIVLFDEFEKVYDSDDQEKILTLLDGVFPSKKLFVLTCNDKWRVDGHMRNRPGRIFYMIDFKGLDQAFIEEYCEERLNDKQHIPTICRLATLFEAFNFDILKSLVEEMNRYRETPHEVLEMLNAKPFTEGNTKHEVKMFVDGKELDKKEFYPQTINSNPVSCQEIELYHYWVNPKNEDDEQTFTYYLTPADLKKIDGTEGTYTFIKGNVKAIFTRLKAQEYNYMNLI